MVKKFDLNKKVFDSNDGYHPTEKVLLVSDVKEFIKRRQEIKDKFECRITGLVWGLAYHTNFNVKRFNLEFDKIRKEARVKSDKLLGGP